MKWSYYNKENILYVGFTNGTILSYTISNTFQYVKLSSRLSLGSPVRFVCLFIYFFITAYNDCNLLLFIFKNVIRYNV